MSNHKRKPELTIFCDSRLTNVPAFASRRALGHARAVPRPRERSDTEILAVTRECIRELGPGVSTVEIARRLGWSQSALFRRFGNKTELFRAAILPPSGPAWIARVEQGPDDRPLREQLRELLEELELFYAELFPHALSVHALLRDENQPPRARQPALARKGLTRWFVEAQERGLVQLDDPEVTAVLFIGCVQAHALRVHALGDRTPGKERFVEGVLALFCRAYARDGRAQAPAEADVLARTRG